MKTTEARQDSRLGYRFLREASEEQATRTASFVPGCTFDVGNAPMHLTSGSVGGTTANAVYIDDTIDIGNWTITPGLRYDFTKSRRRWCRHLLRASHAVVLTRQIR